MGYTDSKGVWRPQDPSEIDPFALAPEQPALGRYVEQLEAALREIQECHDAAHNSVKQIAAELRESKEAHSETLLREQGLARHVEQLEAALREYGDHKPMCHFRLPNPSTNKAGAPCTCGWAEALAPEGGAEEKG